jgi:thioredoxin reductase (NADPH)
VLTEIRGDGLTVDSVSLKNVETGEKRTLPTDGVFIFIGYAPNNMLIPPTIRMNKLGFVVTDEKCETNIPGIFAAGDLRQKFANQIVVAAADGCIAALAAARYVETRRAMALSP